MSDVSSELVKQLRTMTGAGFMDCKNALKEANGSLEAAIEILRKKGLKDVGKRANKVTAEGTLGVYTHAGEQVVAIVELNCETDFVARGAEFKDLAKGIAMHVAAMHPKYTTREEVPSDVIEKEKEIFISQLTEPQKKNIDKILPGKIDKFFEDIVLLEQVYVKDESGKKKIRELLEELSIKVGEKVQLRRFVRFEVGEGIEKPVLDLAADVAALAEASPN
jgi:elongation factor Ts